MRLALIDAQGAAELNGCEATRNLKFIFVDILHCSSLLAVAAPGTIPPVVNILYCYSASPNVRDGWQLRVPHKSNCTQSDEPETHLSSALG